MDVDEVGGSARRYTKEELMRELQALSQRRRRSLRPPPKRERGRGRGRGRGRRKSPKRGTGSLPWCALQSECTGHGIPGVPSSRKGEDEMRSCFFVMTLEELGNVINTFDPTKPEAHYDKYTGHEVLNPNNPRNVFIIDEVHLLIDTLKESSGIRSSWKGSVLAVANWLKSINPNSPDSPTVVGMTATVGDIVCMATLMKGSSDDAVGDDGRLRVDPKDFVNPDKGYVEVIDEIKVVDADGSADILPMRVVADIVQSRKCFGGSKKNGDELSDDGGVQARIAPLLDDSDDDQSEDARAEAKRIYDTMQEALARRAAKEDSDEMDKFVCPLKSTREPLRLARDNHANMNALERLLSGLFFVIDASGDPRLYPQETAHRRLVRRDPEYAIFTARPDGRQVSWRHMSNTFHPLGMAAIVDDLLEIYKRRRVKRGDDFQWHIPARYKELLELISPKFKAIADDLKNGRARAYPEVAGDDLPAEIIKLHGRTAIYIGATDLSKDITSTQFSLALGLYLCGSGHWSPAFLWDVHDRRKYYAHGSDPVDVGTEAQRSKPAVYLLANQRAGRATPLVPYEARTMRRKSFRRAQLLTYNRARGKVDESPTSNDIIILDSQNSRSITLERTSNILLTLDLPDVDDEQVAGRITRSCAFAGVPQTLWHTKKITYVYSEDDDPDDPSCDPYLRAWHCAMGQLGRELRQLIARLSIGCSVFQEYNEGGMPRPNRCGDDAGPRGCIVDTRPRKPLTAPDTSEVPQFGAKKRRSSRSPVRNAFESMSDDENDIDMRRRSPRPPDVGVGAHLGQRRSLSHSREGRSR